MLLASCELPPPHESVTLAQAPASKANSLTITDGHMNFDYMGKLEREARPASGGRGSSGTPKWRFYVVPIVPEGWTPDQPIQAWATCHGDVDTADQCRAQLEAHTGALEGTVACHHNHSGTGKSGWEEAIRALEAERGVVSVDAAAVVRVGHER